MIPTNPRERRHGPWDTLKTQETPYLQQNLLENCNVVRKMHITEDDNDYSSHFPRVN